MSDSDVGPESDSNEEQRRPLRPAVAADPSTRDHGRCAVELTTQEDDGDLNFPSTVAVNVDGQLVN